MSTLEGKVAVVTGGNSGIGLASAQAFAEAGAHVIVFGRNQETLDAAVAQIGHGAVGIQGDVTSGNDLDRLYSTVKDTHGGLDILFANAGVAFFQPFAESDEGFFDHQVNINIKGTFFTIQKALPLLREGSSVLVNTSVVNVMGMPGASVYSATKAALRSLVRTLAAELTQQGIRINAIAPGPIETPIFERTGMSEAEQHGFAQQVLGTVPMARFGKPEEIANTALFLASDASSYITGSEISVDGGMTQV
ncbi:MAG: glucose 1-dehydrogenase [Acidobacteriota bacterium]